MLGEIVVVEQALGVLPIGHVLHVQIEREDGGAEIPALVRPEVELKEGGKAVAAEIFGSDAPVPIAIRVVDTPGNRRVGV